MLHSHGFSRERGLSGAGGFILTPSSLLLRGTGMNVVNTYILITFVLSPAFEDKRSSSDINYNVYVCMINFIRISTCKERLKGIYFSKIEHWQPNK